MDSSPEDERRRLAEALDTIKRGSLWPRRSRAADPVDVAALRKRMGMSQKQFAARFGFPVATLRHWELGDRKPRGAALVLLHVIGRDHIAVLRALAR